MKINPTGPGGPLPPVSNNDLSVKKFSKTPQPDAAGAPEAGQALKAITAEFRKADLQDPAKVDQMLSQCTGELLQSALTRVDGKISPADTANLTEWLQNDPLMRGKLLNYLEQVLT
jgi:hypothetical protein